MPRSFDLSVESPASVEQVHSAFCDEDYWLARLANYGAGTGTLDSLIVDADGTVTVATAVNLLRIGLLSQITDLHGDLKVVLTEVWSPNGVDRARGEVSVAVPGAPLSGFGAGWLTRAPNGSRLECTATVKVKVPLVGATIERFIGGQLAEPIAAIQRFTARWITEHALTSFRHKPDAQMRSARWLMTSGSGGPTAYPSPVRPLATKT
jgi:hypothetical protein